MDYVELKKGSCDSRVVWLKKSLNALGYLKNEHAKGSEFDEKTEDAVNRFRKSLAWKESGTAGRSVQFEIAQQIEALQTKLAALGHFKEKPYKKGIIDEPTIAALNKLKRETGPQCAKEILKEFSLLLEYEKLGLEKKAWTKEVKKKDSDKLTHMLKDLGFMNEESELDDEHIGSLYDYLTECIPREKPGKGDKPDEESWMGGKWLENKVTRRLLRKTPPFTFEEVLHQELSAINVGRGQIKQHYQELSAINVGRGQNKQHLGVTSSDRAHSLTRAHEARLMGLGLSGGGIRSATFNLGVLQALARFGLLKRFDYLSSVSGGGYIAAWLHTWVHHLSGKKTGAEERSSGIVAVERELAGSISDGSGGQTPRLDVAAAGSSGAVSFEPAPVSWLRRYSNYLTPKLGPLSADTMAGVATWLRNVLLNQLMLLLVAISALFLPWLLSVLVHHLNTDNSWSWIVFLIGSLILFFAMCRSVFAISSVSSMGDDSDTRSDLLEARLIMVFLSVACLLIAFSLANVATSKDDVADMKDYIYAATGFTAFAIPSFLFLWFYIFPTKVDDSGGRSVDTQTRKFRVFGKIVAGVLGGVLFALFLILLGSKLPEDFGSGHTLFLTVCIAPPLVLLALLGSLTLQIGLSGRSLSEYTREWWSRIGGVLIRAGLIWLLVTGVALYAALAARYLHDSIVAAGGLAWIITTIGGVLAGRSGQEGTQNSRAKELLLRTAPYVFVGGLAFLVAIGLHYAIIWGGKATGYSPETNCVPIESSPVYELSLDVDSGSCCGPLSASGVISEAQSGEKCDVVSYGPEAYKSLESIIGDDSQLFGGYWLLGLPLYAFLLAVLLGYRVDINVFALHMFYRNRLERCYMGASNPTRNEHPYTDLDPRDSPRLAELQLSDGVHGQRPYPIINTALNLPRSDNLAWQERKAGSFTFTPQHCGYQLPDPEMEKGAYQATGGFVGNIGGWMSLGTPITISGAAASPNSGYHTHSAVAALMTVFNVRLGQWMQNPGMSDVWRKPGPKQSLFYLLKELTASTKEKDAFVYVSDGGHFENLALYELVRRRCRYVVICDAGCDSNYVFEDLGNAVRKCKVDLGIEIEIDTRAIVPDPENGLSECHCAVGIIHYDRVDLTRAAAPGYLLYVKASFTGDEPADVRQYKTQHAEFPHESTGDQWYSESQFESYRALGFHIMSKVLEDPIVDEDRERHRREGRFDAHKLGKPLDKAAAKSGGKSELEIIDREVLFKRLAERWYAPLQTPPESRDHDQMLESLLASLKQDSRLSFLDAQIYPEWKNMVSGIRNQQSPSVYPMFPPSRKELRAGFYYCNQLIQLMETVYQERTLELDYDHPDNRGWMNLFRHWSGSGMFRATWAISVSNYGAKFQQFCGRHLGLDVGRVQPGRWMKFNEAIVARKLLTNAEREQLEKIKKRYHDNPFYVEKHEWDWDKISVVPLEVRVDEPNKSDGESFSFQIGFALVQGWFTLANERSEDDENANANGGRKILFFRIRDHLRRMGLGRRALEALWREDVKIHPDPPGDIREVIVESDPERLMRLWHSVLAAVPDHEVKQAEGYLRDVVDIINARNAEVFDDKAKQTEGVKKTEGYLRDVVDKFDAQNKDKTSIELDDEGRKLELSPLLRQAYLRDRSMVWMDTGEPLLNADKHYRKVLDIQSDNEEAWRGIARIKAYQKEFDSALEILDEVIKNDPNSSLSYYNRAAFRARFSYPDKASITEDLKKAVELNYTLGKIAREDPDLKTVPKNWLCNL